MVSKRTVLHARRAFRVLALTLFATTALWLALAIHPHPLFAHRLRHANVTLHAREPLPRAANAILAEAVRRIARSPLYDASRHHDVFLTGSGSVFALLTFGARGGGLTNAWGNVFVRPADLARDRVFDRHGRPKSGERTLTYFLAHELTHAMTFARLGFFRSSRLAAFQREGYADYVAFARPIDLRAGREALRRGASEMDVKRSGLYRRYELLVAYLLEMRGMDVWTLLARPLD